MRRVAFAILSTVAGLVGLLSFKTEATGSATTSSVAAGTATAGTSGSSAAPSGGVAKSATPSPSRSTASRTVTGNVAETQYGPVQVRITVKNGAVTSATAIEYPTQDPRDAQINAYAVPILQQETAGATSASQVDMVSGATYTSEGYLQSLQSALDKAGL